MDTRPCGVHIRASTEDFLTEETLVHLRTNCHENGSDRLALAKDLYQRDRSPWSAVTQTNLTGPDKTVQQIIKVVGHSVHHILL